LAALSHHWTLSAPLAPHGARQRFIATARAMRASGWPLLDDVHRWRLGEITVAWAAVAPADDGARITRR
ncbi:MAG TPA: SAM-dependent methyltransferase, partial [Dermacoccus sp.]|nr:SAM-dependent methyltransferase [Dermacoccus sp.]